MPTTVGVQSPFIIDEIGFHVYLIWCVIGNCHYKETYHLTKSDSVNAQVVVPNAYKTTETWPNISDITRTVWQWRTQMSHETTLIWCQWRWERGECVTSRQSKTIQDSRTMVKVKSHMPPVFTPIITPSPNQISKSTIPLCLFVTH